MIKPEQGIRSRFLCWLALRPTKYSAGLLKYSLRKFNYPDKLIALQTTLSLWTNVDDILLSGKVWFMNLWKSS